MAALNLAREARFVALQQGQTGGVFSEVLEGEGEARGLVHGFVVPGELVRQVFEDGGLHDPRALEMPAGHGHFLDDQMFAGIGGPMEFGKWLG